MFSYQQADLITYSQTRAERVIFNLAERGSSFHGPVRAARQNFGKVVYSVVFVFTVARSIDEKFSFPDFNFQPTHNKSKSGLPDSNTSPDIFNITSVKTHHTPSPAYKYPYIPSKTTS
jgi:hypothetical protein